eukprot:8612345-Pyramimonas_sp.AAC.1
MTGNAIARKSLHSMRARGIGVSESTATCADLAAALNGPARQRSMRTTIAGGMRPNGRGDLAVAALASPTMGSRVDAISSPCRLCASNLRAPC